MTDTNTTSKKPSHYAYMVKNRGEGQKAIWTRIGAAWPHRDGKGSDIQLDVAPLDGRVTIRIVTDKKD